MWDDGRTVGIIQRVYITAEYSGPCTDTDLPPMAVVLDMPATNLYTIENLEEFSTYRINVTVISSRGMGSDIVSAETTGTGLSGHIPQQRVPLVITFAKMNL